MLETTGAKLNEIGQLPVPAFLAGAFQPSVLIQSVKIHRMPTNSPHTQATSKTHTEHD